MSPCPDLSHLDTMHVDEREAHLAQCSSCRMLIALRDGGDEAFSDECESTEMLLAVAAENELNALDQRRLTRHLEACDRCTSLAGSLLLVDSTSPQPILGPTQTWDSVSSYDNIMPPANDQRSLLFLGFGILTAAAVVFLIVHGLGGTDKKETDGFVADVPSEGDSTAGASRPAPQMPMAPARPVGELLKESSEAITAKKFALGLSLCSEALEQEPANQEAHVQCAVAACNSADETSSRFHISAISNPERSVGVTEICKTLGVALDGPAPMLAKDLLRGARQKVEQEDYQAAQALCTKSLMLEPGYDGARGLCAEIACHLGQADRAQGHIDKISSVPRRAMATRKCNDLRVALVDPRSSPTNTSPGQLVGQVREAFMNKDYATSLSGAEDALKVSPYDPNLLAMASLSACALKNDEVATRYQERLRNSEMRDALEGMCSDLESSDEGPLDPGNAHFKYLLKNGVIPAIDSFGSSSSEDTSDGAPTVADLLEQAEKDVRSTQFEKGLRLCGQVLDLEPTNQRALTACAIAACNLGNPSGAVHFIAQIKSSQRRQGLHQICKRLGLDLETVTARTPKPRPPSPSPPSVPQISTAELLEQAEKAVRSTQFGKGDKLCRQALEREPGNQRALTACAIAACNLSRTSTAKKFIGRVKSSQRRQGLKQICHRLGLRGFNNEPEEPEEPEGPEEPPVDVLLDKVKIAVDNGQFKKGYKYCRQALEQEPNNQMALTGCAITSCNLKKASTAKKYISRVKSSQRRQGLRQICTRLGLPGFTND